MRRNYAVGAIHGWRRAALLFSRAASASACSRPKPHAWMVVIGQWNSTLTKELLNPARKKA